MNGYKAFYKQKSIEVYANTSYEAHQIAVKEFKVRGKQDHQVHVVLCEKDNTPVIHTPEGVTP